MQKAITILGSTGSIGQSTLAVLEMNLGFAVHALTAHQNVDLLFEQCKKFNPAFAVVTDPGASERMRYKLSQSDLRTELLFGNSALQQVASDKVVEIVMASIVGSAGLESTLAAVKAGKRVLLANKEALVMTGDLLMQAAAISHAPIIPIDSEHNAIFQCLPATSDGLHYNQMQHVSKIMLTASGGPFLRTDAAEFPNVTPAQACLHPKWSMGPKISVDSATLMNKGLEVIEACYLFGLPADRVEVLIHPQSIIHSLVYFQDGSVLAQMGNPDMRIPISFGLGWPDRVLSGAPILDLAALQNLEFGHPDLEKFPCLAFGIEAARQKGTAPAVLNAANEVAVAAFLAGAVRFSDIPLIIKRVMSKIPCEPAPSLAIIQNVDAQARQLANELIIKDFCRNPGHLAASR